MHLVSFLYSYSLYIFLGAHPYTLYFITSTKCLNNEHEDNQEIQSKFDFERMSCIDENHSKEDMNDETLSLEMRRLIDHENKQILPHQEVTEVINLVSNEEKKEVKIGTALSIEIKKEIINLFHEFANIFSWSYQDMSGKQQNCRELFYPLNQNVNLSNRS